MPPDERQRSIKRFAEEHDLNVDIFEVGFVRSFRTAPGKEINEVSIKEELGSNAGRESSIKRRPFPDRSR